MTGRIDEREEVVLRLKLPEGEVNRYTSLPLFLQFIEYPSELVILLSLLLSLFFYFLKLSFIYKASQI